MAQFTVDQTMEQYNRATEGLTLSSLTRDSIETFFRFAQQTGWNARSVWSEIQSMSAGMSRQSMESMIDSARHLASYAMLASLAHAGGEFRALREMVRVAIVNDPGIPEDRKLDVYVAVLDRAEALYHEKVGN